MTWIAQIIYYDMQAMVEIFNHCVCGKDLLQFG